MEQIYEKQRATTSKEMNSSLTYALLVTLLLLVTMSMTCWYQAWKIQKLYKEIETIKDKRKQ